VTYVYIGLHLHRFCTYNRVVFVFLVGAAINNFLLPLPLFRRKLCDCDCVKKFILIYSCSVECKANKVQCSDGSVCVCVCVLA